ncbi:YeeE/YedE family protein [Fontimonas sp. SYSU GA230001]|uniref:YeeE/YedE family protein n=1 Tax=Fontimonas sp. SYSU GA230001 TaxID=3142450 RepID=UPI0032B578F9
MSIGNFTPIPAALGGLIIGLSVLLLMLGAGRIAGVSGMLGCVLGRLPAGDRSWRLYFLGGLVLGGVLYSAFAGPVGPLLSGAQQLWPAMLGAALVGFGTRMANGCTSGHGICGISRFSARSIVATLSFMASGFVTVFVVRHLL